MKKVGTSCIGKFSHLRWDGCLHYEKENDYFVYHNTMTVTISTGCSAKAPENASPTRKGAQEVCKPMGGSIFARMDRLE